MSTIEETINSLRKDIEEHNYRYYILSDPIIDDIEFDHLMKRLEVLEEEYPEFMDFNSPTNRVGERISQGFESVPHKVPMLSLSNSYNYDEVADFWNKVKQESKDVLISSELKFDGLSISVIYIDGVLNQALTRGDGLLGDDVTQNIKAIKSIPLRLRNGKRDVPHRVEVRGEILLPYSEFERINKERQIAGEQPFANPRNAASGTIKSLDPKVVYQRNLDCIFYLLLSDDILIDSHVERLKLCHSWGLKTSKNTKLCSSLVEVQTYIEYWDTARKELPYATDGVVLKVDQISLQDRIGQTAKSPKWAIAYKYQAERVRTKLKGVSYQVGRTGVVVPVAELDPVLISGTVVRRATLHNADFINSLELQIGDYVFVEKGGEIIPKIISVDLDSRIPSLEPVEYPKLCPDCSTPLEQHLGEVAFFCPNTIGCPMQIKGALEHFCSRKAANINIGKETISALYERGFVRNIQDFYHLTEAQLLQLDGFKERATVRLLKSIEESKTRPYHSILFGMGIRHVGENVAKLLCCHYPSIRELEQASIEELVLIEDIGLKIAESIKLYFSLDRNLECIKELEDSGVNLQEHRKDNFSREKILEDQKIVVSGVFQHHSREEYTQIIESLGGKKVSSISSKTSFVLAGESMGTSKREKAQELKIRILSEEDFLNMIGEL